MAARPTPPHGTTARAYGSPGYRPPCKCEPCNTARRRHHKQTRVNRQLGRSPFTSPDQAQARLQELHQTMSWKTLVTATGLELNALLRIYNGQRTKIRNETHAKIMAVTAPAQGDRGQYLDATGSTRRAQALSYLGHSYATIAGAANTSHNRILSIANGRQPTIRRDLAERLEAAYRQLASVRPTANKYTSRTRNFARANGWAPPGAWDDDTIDDPTAAPDWTGYCGTDRGWWIHQRQQLPMCQRCDQAHQEWLAEHNDLDPRLRNQALFKARNAAVSREADLAADGRELLGYGVSYEQAAARLGVSKNHLQQALKRHPQTETELAA
jgi:hypothetical protein